MALLVQNGAIVEDKSVVHALVGVTYDGASSDSGSITSKGDQFNGIVVGGSSSYSVTNMAISLIGSGADDFIGFGAGLLSTDTASLTVSKTNVTTNGAIRPAIVADGQSTLHVKDSTIDSTSAASTDGVATTFMKEVPWVLGIRGNCRSTIVLETAKAVYENSTIRSESWGALSTDSCKTGATLTAIPRAARS
jgi:hypothetical protein